MKNLLKVNSNIVIIDDDKEFISSIQNLIEENFKNYKTFNLTSEAITFINSKKQDIFKDYVRKIEAEEASNIAFEIDFLKLRNSLNSKNIRDHIGVVVSDYQLDDKNGLDVFNSIVDKDIYKILLTSVADENIAIAAFNEGVIDCYLRKRESSRELVNKICKGFSIFFERKSAKIMNYYNENNRDEIALFNPEYKALFSTLINSKNIEEYASIDKEGSFILKNKADEDYCILIMNQNTVEAQLEVATYYGLEDEVKYGIKKLKKMLYLPLVNDDSSTSGVSDLVYDCHVLDKKYVYSIVDNKSKIAFN